MTEPPQIRAKKGGDEEADCAEAFVANDNQRPELPGQGEAIAAERLNAPLSL